MNIKMHTGCNCPHCRRGRNSQVRRMFHRRLRRIQKKQLRDTGDIKDATFSIGYTD